MKVYLIGAGPGDAGLLTLKGRDALANDSLLGHARPDAERIYVGKVAGNHALPQHEINALLVRKAKEGKVVARLKGGDPYIFGRGGEEAEELLAAGVPFEEVPGISSTIAAPAYAGIPLWSTAAPRPTSAAWWPPSPPCPRPPWTTNSAIPRSSWWARSAPCTTSWAGSNSARCTAAASWSPAPANRPAAWPKA